MRVWHSCVGALIFVCKKVIFDPYYVEMQELRGSIDKLNRQMDDQHQETKNMHEETKQSLKENRNIINLHEIKITKIQDKQDIDSDRITKIEGKVR